MPLVRQLPKRGFKNIFAKEYATVNVSELEVFENGTEVTSAMLVEKKMPDEYINAAGNGVTQAFMDWCAPLIGEPLGKLISLR